MAVYSLKNKNQVRSVLAGNQPFVDTPPPVTTNLIRWYDASDASTITYASSTNVSQWNTKYGTGNLTQATSGQQPNTGVLTKNSRSVITFTDANNDVLSGTQPTSGNSSFTVICVLRGVNNGTGQSVISWGSANYVGGNFYMEMSNGGAITSGFAGSQATYAIASTASHSGNWVVVTSTFNGSVLTQKINNLDSKSITVGAMNISSSASPLYVGWQSDPYYGIYGWDGSVADILVYSSALSGTDQTSVYTWLQSKWAL
jgi:hypothetical protein